MEILDWMNNKLYFEIQNGSIALDWRKIIWVDFHAYSGFNVSQTPKNKSKRALQASRSRWETGISKQISNGKQLSPPKNKFGKGYKHDKSHFWTDKWTLVLVRISVYKRLWTTSARDVSYLDSGEEEWRTPVAATGITNTPADYSSTTQSKFNGNYSTQLQRYLL